MWANGLKFIKNREDLSFEVKDKIMVDDSGEVATLIKAKAIGVRGIITQGEKIVTGIPMVRLNTEQIGELKKWEKESDRIWLNGISGKIFIT